MADNEYETIKKVMENKQLVDELEKVSPGITAQMAGHLCRPWLPYGATRRILMAIIALVAIGYQFYLLLLLLPLFSPRIVGEVTMFLGKITKK